MKHVRIDEGLKRGPRTKSEQTAANRSRVTTVAVAGLQADLVPSEVIERYLADENTADIAASYGISHSRLNQWLLEHAEEAWRRAQVARAVSALETATVILDEANDPMTLARAREQLRGAQWRLERLCTRLFGQHTHITVEQVGDLGERLRRARERVIEREVLVPQVSDSTNDASQHE
jgi:hypothetical protein